MFFKNNLADKDKTISIFQRYCDKERVSISGDNFYKNLQDKGKHERFRSDMDLLLPEGAAWDFDEAFEFVVNTIILAIP